MATSSTITELVLTAVIFKSMTLEKKGLHSNEMIMSSFVIDGTPSGRSAKKLTGKE